MGRPHPVLPTRDALYQAYFIEKLGIVQIAHLYHCRTEFISDALREYGFYPTKKITKAWLEEQYILLERSLPDIAAELGVTEAAIQWHIHQHGIPFFPRNRSSVRLPILHDREWLYDQYHNQHLSLAELSAKIGCAISSLYTAMRRLDIPRRRLGGRPPQKTGPMNYKGAFTRLQCERIKVRDGYQCRFPGCDQTSKRLHIHHIIPRRLGGTNIPQNGITLCLRCHRKTLHREEEFIALFQSILLASDIQEPPA